jgi:rhodanese-related sulfurtransferase
MKRNLYINITLILFSVILALGIRDVSAYELITAQEAYDMVNTGQAIIIDVRTIEENVFVGSPALEPGGESIAYLISWKIFEGIDENGSKKFIDNPDFDTLANQTFGDDKTQPLIIMCASGIRSSYAAQRLEALGFKNVYEIDNKLKETRNFPGGMGGGFQGSSYNGLYDGYKGYPYRTENKLSDITLETETNNIDNENDSVSWMDTGLPITHKIDPNKIPKIKKDESSNVTKVKSQTIIPFINYQWLPGLTQQLTYPTSFYQSLQIGSMFQYGQQFSSILPYSRYQTNQLLYPYSNALNIQQLISCQPSSPTLKDLEQTGSL